MRFVWSYRILRMERGRVSRRWPALPGEAEHVAHCENSLPPYEPIGGFQRALREDSPIPRQMAERQLFERAIENQLVRPRHRSCPNAGSRNLSSEMFGGGLSNGDRRSRWRVLLLVVMGLDDVRVEVLERAHQSAGVTGELDHHVHSEREVGGPEERGSG